MKPMRMIHKMLMEKILRKRREKREIAPFPTEFPLRVKEAGQKTLCSGI